MEEEYYYIGTDLKFRIDISASGFSQETDPYEIRVVCNNKSISIPKESVIEGDDGYYIIIDTSQFSSGMIKLIVTAYVPDEDLGTYNDGYRKEVETFDLCYIKKP